MEGIEYRVNEASGIGMPGDNETGLVVYRLSSATAARISRRGLAYLQKVGRTARDGKFRGRYWEWEVTPASRSREGWGRPVTGGEAATEPVRLADYLDQYGFGIPIEAEVEASIDRALANPGSYFAFGRTGVFIVIPAESIAVFGYAG